MSVLFKVIKGFIANEISIIKTAELANLNATSEEKWREVRDSLVQYQYECSLDSVAGRIVYWQEKRLKSIEWIAIYEEKEFQEVDGNYNPMVEWT